MNATQVKEMDWTNILDWQDLSISEINLYGQYVGKEDIDVFVEKTFKQIARDLEIPYSELEPILKEANTEFFEEEKRLYEKVDGYSKGNVLLARLKDMLKVPKIHKTIKVAVF